MERHDIIQIKPDRTFGPALAIVDKVHTWGVTAFVLIPRRAGASGCDEVYVRLNFDDIESVGAKAVFVKDEEDGQ